MLYIASDHGGYALKEILKQYLSDHHIVHEDLGPKLLDATDDYPDYAALLAKKIAAGEDRGILLCRNGIGVCIVANKFKEVRAGIGYSVAVAQSSRADDDTNILCLPADALTPDLAKSIVQAWITTPFSNEDRHKRRLSKIIAIEKQYLKDS